jgi:hypothetical protein
MHRWLMQDYGLSERGASLLMGQSARIRSANVVDPRFTMVAKMRKSTLAGPQEVIPGGSTGCVGPGISRLILTITPGC